MSQLDVQNILLPILTSIITGGFILVLVEIGNRKNRLKDKYDQIMWPFMRKLSSYFRFMNWCRGRRRYPDVLNENETNFKLLVDKVSKYGGKLIVSGGDCCIDDFSAAELYNICHRKISNISYYHEQMHPCRLSWDNFCGTEELIAKELKELFPNYLSYSIDVNLVSKVSGDFYTDIYQVVEFETFRYEDYLHHYNRQTIFAAGAVAIVLMLLVFMLFVPLSVCVMQIAGVIVVILLAVCLLLLGVETSVQIVYYNRICDFLSKQTGYIKRRIFRDKKNIQNNDDCRE